MRKSNCFSSLEYVTTISFSVRNSIRELRNHITVVRRELAAIQPLIVLPGTEV